MTVYSYSQLEGLWIDAGGSKTLAPLMAAIAEAESSGNSQAQNPSGATGLWQILGPPPGQTVQEMFNPADNAKAAVWKYKNQGLGAWTTYTSGAYKQFLRGNVPPNTGKFVGPASGNATPSGGIDWNLFADAGTGINDLFSALGQASGLTALAEAIGIIAKDLEGIYKIFTWLTLPSNWVRIFAGIFGAALLGAGVYLVGKEAQA